MRMPRLGMVIALVVAVLLTACSSGGDKASQSNTPVQPATSSRLNLKGICPNPIVAQTDWDPESEYGVYYHLLGSRPHVDKARKRIRGPLVAEGTATGIQLEVRAGGPSIGFEPVTSQMYQDQSITLGQISTDEAVRFSAKQPTLAVVAPMEISPFMIMWDPVTYPQFTSVADIGKTNTKVLYFQGDTYMEYLISAGILHRSQTDGSYDGKPANFVAAGGKVAQAGFATSEPYIYQHELRAWDKPVKYGLINDTGYPFYPQALSIRTGDKAKLAPCLKKLVPIVQRAQIDFLQHPDATNRLIVDLVRQYNTGWQYSAGLASYAIGKMRSDFVTNGQDSTLGNFNLTRVQRVVDIVTPIFTAQRKPPRSGLKAQDIATNEFIDASIGTA
jgi:hypothetical protein